MSDYYCPVPGAGRGPWGASRCCAESPGAVIVSLTPNVPELPSSGGARRALAGAQEISVGQMNGRDTDLHRDNTGEAASPKSNLLDSNPRAGKTWAWMPALLCISYVTLGNLLNPSLPLFSPLYNGHNNTTLFIKLSWG